MNRIKIFLTELEEEAITTRKMLERVPTDKFEWQPHPKSMTLKRLATHVAELPSWIAMTINTDELDPAIPKNLNIVTKEAVSAQVNVTMSNTFGFGGHNASVIFKKYEE